ncbi:hypothetical protein KP509_09G027300 [Ceratopteris richardii]|uniref:GRF-type domain-containing protein n=1 Tax=Ceratopteris richardii TaxID=49495 RepID=A0A8T2U544_CERRI|nr:hypothetical protein KP509_09G027300 [Ceratopteris richardii]
MMRTSTLSEMVPLPLRWIDQPRVTKEEMKEARALKREKKDTGNTPAIQPARMAKRSVKGSRNHAMPNEVQISSENHNVEAITSLESETHDDALKSGSLVGRDDPIEENGKVICTSDILLSRVPTEDAQFDNYSVTEQQHESCPDLPSEYEAGSNNPKDIKQHSTQMGHGTDFNLSQDKRSTVDDKQLHNEDLEVPSCLCGRAAELKTVSRGPNKGLRFWVCWNSRPFYVKKKTNGEESCKFFRWVDTPCERSDALKNAEKQRKRENRKRKELSLLS